MGVLTDVTVCAALSLFVQIKVLFVPMTTVTLPGPNPDIGATDETFAKP